MHDQPQGYALAIERHDGAPAAVHSLDGSPVLHVEKAIPGRPRRLGLAEWFGDLPAPSHASRRVGDIFCADSATLAFVRAAIEEKIARNRGDAGWTAWRIFAVDVLEEADELVRIAVYCDQFPERDKRSTQVFVFFVSEAGDRRSGRLDALFAACGVTERVNDDYELEGRYFATRNGGRSPEDFAPLSMAFGEAVAAA